MDRSEAYALLTEYTQNPSLIKHALAVEVAMRAYARKFGEDEETWGIIGLLHDFDYERYPTAEDHPYMGAEILRAKKVPEDWIISIMSHADYTGIPRATLRDKVLFAVDELSGFLVAVALVRPDKKIATVKVSSVKKKMKQKAFSAQVSREDIVKGAAELGIDLDEHIAFVIEAMTCIAAELEL
ncbi:MAG TPA: HDIG domain-containing protein [Acidobacteriota bacterium]|nr:HDIG domain-containing protein [Acidobacteriota bacterium]